MRFLPSLRNTYKGTYGINSDWKLSPPKISRGIELETFRFWAQRLNHAPMDTQKRIKKITIKNFKSQSSCGVCVRRDLFNGINFVFVFCLKKKNVLYHRYLKCYFDILLFSFLKDLNFKVSLFFKCFYVELVLIYLGKSKHGECPLNT